MSWECIEDGRGRVWANFGHMLGLLRAVFGPTADGLPANFWTDFALTLAWASLEAPVLVF